jgi:hypothetical protein
VLSGWEGVIGTPKQSSSGGGGGGGAPDLTRLDFTVASGRTTRTSGTAGTTPAAAMTDTEAVEALETALDALHTHQVRLHDIGKSRKAAVSDAI